MTTEDDCLTDENTSATRRTFSATLRSTRSCLDHTPTPPHGSSMGTTVVHTWSWPPSRATRQTLLAVGERATAAFTDQKKLEK